MKKVKAMYTVEAAIIFPMLFFLIAGGIGFAISLHKEVRAVSDSYGEVEQLDSFDTVKKLQLLAELGGITCK